MKNTLLALVFLVSFSSVNLPAHAQSTEYKVRNYELYWDNSITLGDVNINVDEDPKFEAKIRVNSIVELRGVPFLAGMPYA